MVLNRYNKLFFTVLGSVVMGLFLPTFVARGQDRVRSVLVEHRVRSQSWIMVSQADQKDGFLIIDKPGNYQLTEDLFIPVLILADHVQFDLHGHAIYSNHDDYAIITVGPSATNVYILTAC